MSRTADRDAQLSPVKRALLEIRGLRAKIEEAEYARNEPIAVVGMGLRFPGNASDPESFWRLLRDGVDAITEVPPDRWDVNAYYDPDPDASGKMSTRWGGFLKTIDMFDPEFFGISPREAVSMDPQQRLLLEVAWESLENAGLGPEKLFGSPAGVFIGIASFDYVQNHLQQLDQDRIDAYFATGNTHSVASGRLSYVLGLRGPSISLDTACSSSLVAIHQACQSLRNGDCNLALAGGVNVILRPELHINFSKTHVMAADGRCKAFDSRADGFVRSEGCGIVVLKKLSDAIQDADRVLAVIRATAVNQDGRSSGLTVPNGPSQQDVIRKALVNAGVVARQVQYVEAHGTGTALGDPIEVQALSEVLGEGRSKSEPLVIGSVKTNIGHLEAAAGVAGLIKVILALQHQQIPPHLHVKTLNPHIPWKNIPVTVATGGMPWPAGTRKRIAGVSSFGFSGTNAHIVVEEAPRQKQQEQKVVNNDRPLHLLTLSAKVEPALQDQISRLAEYLNSEGNVALGNVAYTANTGRSHLSRRLALIAATTQQAHEKLRSLARGVDPAGVYRGDTTSPDRPEVVFLFDGQGEHHVPIGRHLYDTQPAFRKALEECEEYLRPHLERPLRKVLYPEDDDRDLPHASANTQLCLFAMEYALAQLWRSWGIEPSAVIGHGMGEYVAACLAGVFSLEDGLRLVAERERMMQALPVQGATAAVFAAEGLVREVIRPYADAVSIAAINGTGNIVISGETRAVRKALAELEREGIRTQQLHVSNAGHSSLMEPMLEDFEAAAKQVHFKSPEIPLISNLTGTLFHAEHSNAAYWRRHARETVRFADGMRTLYGRGYRLFLEIGPHTTLCESGRQSIPDGAALWLSSLRRDRDDWQQMLESLAQLYAMGMNVDWHGFDRNYDRCRIVLPTYPFQREHYWLAYEDDRRSPRIENPALQWKATVAAGRRQSMQVPIDLGLHTYEAKWQSLQALTTAYIIRALRQMGVFTRPGESHAAEELNKQCRVVPTYHGLILRWLARLSDEGLLLRQDQRFICADALPEPDIGLLQHQARQNLHDIGFLMDYIERCGSMLTSILTGRESPLETLFPAGSLQTAEKIYQQWALSRYFNGIIAAVVDEYVRDLAADRKIRILEVGAGTGSTTSEVLPVLPADRTLYLYTDLSEVFFHQARQKFNAYPFVNYGSLDIERSPRHQGYDAHSVNIVIAANVLHATRNLAEAVQNVLSMLAPGGLLVLYEVTDPHTWFDTTVALIEGWQLFNDDMRKNGPLLTAQQWQTLLLGQGFTDAVAFPQTGSGAEILKAHVIVARAPKSGESGKIDLSGALAEPSEQRIHSEENAGQSSLVKKHQDAAVLVSQLKQATPVECHEILIDYVRGHVIRVLNRDPSKSLNRHHRLMDLGVDSLMAVELRNRLGIGLGLRRPLPATLIFDYATIDAVARFLAKETLSCDGEAYNEQSVSRSEAVDSKRTITNRIEDLSEQEVEVLVLEKLKSLEKTNR